MTEMTEADYLECCRELYAHNPKPNLFKTENVLNRTTWIDGWGDVNELKDLDKNHLQNILFFLYKKRDRYWLNCNDVSLIEKYKNGDEFFQKVIRKSTLWRSIFDTLQAPEESFNFKIDE